MQIDAYYQEEASIVMTADEIQALWRTRAEEWGRFHIYLKGQDVAKQVLRDLTAIIKTQSEEVLTLTTAAQRSGYSLDHLARLLREGKIPNAGRRGAPRIRAADLPRRPRWKSNVDHEPWEHYDPIADARSLRNER